MRPRPRPGLEAALGEERSSLSWASAGSRETPTGIRVPGGGSEDAGLLRREGEGVQDAHAPGLGQVEEAGNVGSGPASAVSALSPGTHQCTA